MNVNGEKKIIRAKSYYAASEIGETMDFVVIVTKGHYIESAIQGALCLFDEHTACMAIQNGMGNVDILSKYVDKSQIYASNCPVGRKYARSRKG